MKNLLLIIILILTASVMFLYYKVYHENGSNHLSKSPTGKAIASDIVFINSDSLLDNYPYFSELKSALQRKQDSIENILKSRSKNLENEIKAYQEKGAGMSDQQRQQQEEMLMQKQQSLMQYKQELLDQLTIEESNMNDSLHANLVSALKRYNRNRKYDFILGYQKGSGILLANDSLDVTTEVLESIREKGMP